MKFLRNPIVVGILAVGAVLMVFLQIFKPQFDRWRSRVSSGTGAAATAAQQTGVGKPLAAPATPKTVAKAAKPGTMFASPKRPADSRDTIDAEYVATHFVEWVDAPRRDPFVAPDNFSETTSVAEGPNPVPTWKLTGIWRQTGGRAAAVNGHVYSEGDFIEGWVVERIDVDEVWFRGTNRVERLRFPSFDPIPMQIQEPVPVRKTGPKPRLMQEHTVSPQPIFQ